MSMCWSPHVRLRFSTGSTMSGKPVMPAHGSLWGVSSEDRVLRFGPSGSQRIQAGLFLSVGIAIGAFTLAISAQSGSYGGIVAGTLMSALSLTAGVGLLRRRVIATPSHLRLRAGIRESTIDWTDIASLDVVDSFSGRTAWRVSSLGAVLRVRPVGKWSIGVARLRDGSTVRLPSFVSAARGEGLSMSGPTPTERRVDALRRYRESVEKSK